MGRKFCLTYRLGELAAYNASSSSDYDPLEGAVPSAVRQYSGDLPCAIVGFYLALIGVCVFNTLSGMGHKLGLRGHRRQS